MSRSRSSGSTGLTTVISARRSPKTT
jgi:hypothetical protein